jgi:putative tryptophan/tyrosine transport system substrate-binding protein
MQMKNIGMLLLAGLLFLLSSTSTEAQGTTKKHPVLCFVTFDPARSPRFAAFFKELEDLGYVDGHNIEILYLSADNNGGRYPALIDECLSRKPDVIATTTTPAARLLKQATKSIPIVSVALGDPLGSGLVDSLSRPSENITGTSSMVPETAVKRLEILGELVPGIKHILILSYLADPIAPLQVQAMQEAAQVMGLRLHVHDIKTPEDIPVALDEAIKEGAQGAVVTAESMFFVHRAKLAQEAAARKMPVIYPSILSVTDAGGLMAYAVKAPDLHRQAAIYVDRILVGVKVADLPVQQPTTFEFVINMKVAGALGLTIPTSILLRATDLVE